MNKRKASHLQISNEVDKYLNDPFESPNNDDFNLLEWWKANSGRYPILSKITRDVFALPSSTVASKNAFSLSGRVVDPFRASLTPKMVEALVRCNDWLRSEEFKLYKEPTEEEVAFYKELEDVENGKYVITYFNNNICYLLLSNFILNFNYSISQLLIT